MIGIDGFRERMKAEAVKSKEIKSVEASGRNLEDALRQASLELGLPVRILEYEIIERGRRFLPGLKSSGCRILAYESVSRRHRTEDTGQEDELDLSSYENETAPEVQDADGRVSVRFDSEGVWIKVYPARGNGVPATLDDLKDSLARRGVDDADMKTAEQAVNEASETWLFAADFINDPVYDALPVLEVSADEMEASIKVTEPGPGGADLTAADIYKFLGRQGIQYGIMDDALLEFEAFPVYGMLFPVARGSLPVSGEDARVIYNFETQPDKIHIHEREDGSVDFRELNKYQNVVKGQTLARKVPPGPGTDGQDVFGRYTPARDGRDLEIGLGNNVTITDNGATVIAAESGHVMLKGDKITVETILVIPGNIDSGTGNINTLSSVEIKGNVEDDYSVTAQGNIEVAGFVGKANLSAGGDIIVSRGINGGEGTEFGNISAGKSIWSSFIQNAQAQAGEHVIVSAGIVNSDVVAQKKVLCKGRRAKIVGGHVRASEEVNAVTLGSGGGAETVIEVGFDPKSRDELDALLEQRDAVAAKRDMVDLNLHGLKNQVETKRRRLSKEKEQLFEELKVRHNELHKKLKSVDDEIQKKQEYLNELMLSGRISAASKVLSGVVLRIRDVEYIVKDPYDNPVTFVLDDDFIRTVKFQDIEEDLTREGV